LGKIIKKRNRSNPIKKSRMVRTVNEKSRINAGIMATIGATRLNRYKLFEQNKPLERFGNALMSPSFAILLDTLFKPEIHIEFSSL
jgi:hypothetical protein